MPEELVGNCFGWNTRGGWIGFQNFLKQF